MSNPLTPFTIALKNIRCNLIRSISLVILTGFFAFTLFCGSFLIKSMDAGMHALSYRLGADIIVVPEGYNSKVEAALLRGEPNNFYLNHNVINKIKAIQGVDLISPQLFIASLSAGCCSYPIQIIGLDFDTDFNILPWLDSYTPIPQGQEVIVGNNVAGDLDHKVRFFNQAFTIVGRLAKTGMGFDNSVFMTMENAKRLAKEYERIMQHPVAQDEDLVSSVLIRTKNGFQPRQVAKEIKNAFKGESVYPLVSKQMMSSISDGISNLSVYMYVLVGMLWLFSLVILYLVFSSIFNERRREFALLRVMGLPKGKLMALLFWEVFDISFVGALCGGIFGSIMMLVWNTSINSFFKLPYLTPSWWWFISIFLIVIFLVIVSGLSGVLKISVMLFKREPMRDLYT